MHETAKDVHRTISNAFGEDQSDQSVPLKVKPVFGLGEEQLTLTRKSSLEGWRTKSPETILKYVKGCGTLS
jgi:hypothetical protein